jgi:hypothetical protein
METFLPTPLPARLAMSSERQPMMQQRKCDAVLDAKSGTAGPTDARWTLQNLGDQTKLTHHCAPIRTSRESPLDGRGGFSHRAGGFDIRLTSRHIRHFEEEAARDVRRGHRASGN